MTTLNLVEERRTSDSGPAAGMVGAATAGFAAAVFAAGFAADLLSKQWAVSHAGELLFNSRPSDLPLRVAMSLVAIGVATLLARFVAARGLGRQWGMWTGCALLVSGTLANGVSPLLWARGVPDFIDVGGGWVWNLADFEIAVGMCAGIVSVGFSAIVVYAREQVALRRATGGVSASGV